MSIANVTRTATLVEQIEAQQAALQLTDYDLCEAVGFERTIMLTLIKAGTMKMPLTRIPAFAAALEIDPAELFRSALRESDPALAQVIEQVFNPLHLTATEVNLIMHLRELYGDRAVAPIVFDGKGVVALVAA
jgi:hypothetical protein